MPSLFVITSPILSAKTSLLVIASLFVLASSCGIGTHQSTLSGGCATCPDTAAGCDTFKPLYMKDYESCMKCDSFTATTQTDNWLELDKCLSVAQLVRARQLSSKGTYQSLDGCDECPVAPKGCDTHRPLYMKIYRSCMKCFLTDTTTSIPSTSSTSSPAMSSSNTIWVVLGVLGGLIFVGLLFAKFILPCLIKWYKRRGSDKSDPEQILIPSENMDENQYQSDSADSNLAPTPVNRRPPSFNPRPTLPNPGPTPFNLGPTPFNQGPTPSNPGPTPFNPGPTTSNPGPTTSNPANMRVHLNADNQVNDLDKGNNEEVSVLEEYDETLRETEV